MTFGVVLDIETAPDRALLMKRGLTVHAAQAKPSLHRLSAFACLSFWPGKEGQCTRFDMTSSLIVPCKTAVLRSVSVSEVRALDAIESRLHGLGGGVLVTFNGKRHDLPFLSQRRHSLGSAGSSPSLSDPQDHRDMMELCRQSTKLAKGGRVQLWPSLSKACADAGIPHDSRLFSSEISAVVRKCETDVLATFLLYLLHSAGGDREAADFCSGWTSLARWCLKGPAQAHRRQFAFSEGARAAIRRTLGIVSTG